MNLYSDSWQPKKEGKWVGPAYPFIAASSKSKVIAVLPRIGDQLFFFQLENNELVPKGETLINHPKRKRGLVFNPEDEPLLYPSENVGLIKKLFYEGIDSICDKD
ncbi:hypothetical protein [Algoriphagus boritolerans]|uniref:Uncharacterized protein n=1 Tax=Algoriphagus boritolerans DSM 17298 = JCM 18970 TaxID=1120964 RepID=A0A1H5T8N2_9BACT|nr:hypothetical protein [Algoriphagus boritolerans]SEF58337.1 hypothetical protein SAMN03080598_00717 [Algoriphagus boritolerans DSM 17298 = JCM 18970]